MSVWNTGNTIRAAMQYVKSGVLPVSQGFCNLMILLQEGHILLYTAVVFSSEFCIFSIKESSASFLITIRSFMYFHFIRTYMRFRYKSIFQQIHVNELLLQIYNPVFFYSYAFIEDHLVVYWSLYWFITSSRIFLSSLPLWCMASRLVLIASAFCSEMAVNKSSFDCLL